MRSIEQLIEVLALCVPQLDQKPLRAGMPESNEQSDVLDWLFENLEQQGLLVYEEWKEYFGDVPELLPLSTIDFSAFDSEYVVSLVDDLDEEQLSPELAFSLPYELPYLEYLNAYLRDHGLRVVDLLPFENAYMLAVKDDELLLERLSGCLQAFGMEVNPRDALDEQQAKAYLERLLTTAN
ncbi:hypothetical protein [Serratia marcescens]|uniref:hypothetical protein n=1 Tax=Serratia marcescens TaxID=615 RepID=UPI0009F1CE97|nr:hypothetical protein [Serratia marcescens]OQV32006.1 hypothetical protein BV901_19525 [Serratia nematodiphila]WGL76564.1 hypothetical protein QFB82_19165 [Serratia marcescens]